MKKNYKIGLKLWSTNENYKDEALKLYKESYVHYFEIYVIPGSFSDTHKLWKSLKVPCIIHAPHFKHGMNLSLSETKEKNKELAEESFRYADALSTDIVIFHPGVNGKAEETAKQIKELNDKRIVLENKPYYGIGENLVCVGSLYDEIEYILNETSTGFCLDVGHAICAANARKIDALEYVKLLNSLNPVLYHLTDGDFSDVKDKHEHYGKGSFPLKDVLKIIPNASLITNEAVKDSKENLDDVRRDIDYLRKYY